MQFLPDVPQYSYEWFAMWHALSQHPFNQGLPDPKAASSPTLSEVWQFMDSSRYGPEIGNAGIKHCFRHRFHPRTSKREYVRIPVTRSYLHTTFTPDQPNPSLLVEWIRALQADFIPKLCSVYSDRAGGNCTTGMLLSIAGLLKPAGGINFDHIETITQAHRAFINHYDIEQVIPWLLELPVPADYDHFFFDLQERNDKRASTFPDLADYLLAQPFIKARYDQLIQAAALPQPGCPPGPNNTFNPWMEQVDALFLARCGITSSDMEDQCYRDYFEDGMQPEEVVEMVLEELNYADF